MSRPRHSFHMLLLATQDFIIVLCMSVPCPLAIFIILAKTHPTGTYSDTPVSRLFLHYHFYTISLNCPDNYEFLHVLYVYLCFIHEELRYPHPFGEISLLLGRYEWYQPNNTITSGKEEGRACSCAADLTGNREYGFRSFLYSNQ